MKKFLPILLILTVDNLGFGIILPLLPYYAKNLSLGDQAVGYLIAAYSFFQFFASPLLGAMSDRWGRRPLLIYSQLGSLLGFLLLGTAAYLPYAVYWLFIARIVDGISGGNITVAQAYISDVAEPSERAKSYGLIGVSFGVGFLIGPALGGTLAKYNYLYPAFLAAGFSGLSLLGTFFFLAEPPHHAPVNHKFGLRTYLKVLDFLDTKSLRQMLLLFFFYIFPFVLYVSMFSLYAYHQLHFDPQQTGYFFAFVGMLGIIWQGGAVGPLVKSLGEAQAIKLGLFFCTIGLLSVALVDVWWKLAFVGLFYSFGSSITRPSITSLVTELSPPDQRGGILGVTASIESFCRIVAPILGGLIIGNLQPKWLGIVGGAITAIALALSLWQMPLIRRQATLESSN
jgi:MFS transporter, DHA1 family, tetracycline resistance protein